MYKEDIKFSKNTFIVKKAFEQEKRVHNDQKGLIGNRIFRLLQKYLDTKFDCLAKKNHEFKILSTGKLL